MSHYRAGDIVSRRKGLVMHKGVVLPDGNILHNTPFRGEHVCSPREFGSGQRLYVTSPRGDDHLSRVYRAVPKTSKGYNLFTNNCEHTVSRVTHGASESPQLRSWIDDELLRERERLTVDLSDVDFIDSTALAELVRGMKRARLAGGDLRIARPSETVRVILELTRLDAAFDIVDAEDLG